MSALYLSISSDQASSLPARHSLTSRVSFHAPAVFFGALAVTVLIARRSPANSSDKVVPHSRVRKAPKPPGENYQLNSSRPPKCPGSPEISSAGSPQESPARGHTVSSSAQMSAPTSAPRSAGQSPPPTQSRDEPATDSRDASRRSTATR